MPRFRSQAAAASKDIRALLDRTRADLLAQLAGAAGDDRSASGYDRYLAAQRAEAIRRALEDLDAQARAVSDRTLAKLAVDGAGDVADRIEQLLGPAAPRIGVDVPTLQLVQDLAGAQVTGVLDDARRRINIAMQRGMAGALDLPGMAKEIDEALGGDAPVGRVENILRTESVRAYSQSEAAAVEKLAEGPVADELIKRWRVADRTARTRPSHLAIDGQERELKDLFNVGGGATAATPPGSGVGHEANGPADPSLPVEEAASCRCTVHYVLRSAAEQPYIARSRAGATT
jgi:hypothetical protein